MGRIEDILRHRCELKSNFVMAGKFGPIAHLFIHITEFNLTKIDDLIGEKRNVRCQKTISLISCWKSADQFNDWSFFFLNGLAKIDCQLFISKNP